MPDETIQSQDIKVADVFQAFYVVPDYQREYVWEAEQVEQLLSDINAELGNEPYRVFQRLNYVTPATMAGASWRR